jgi:thymidine phosphorylase
MTEQMNGKVPTPTPDRACAHTQLGCFFLVVGPSGAGKDSLMDGARHRLSKQPFVFAKRVITRPPGMVGEDYTSCDPATFTQRKSHGDFLFTWQAHGYEYGLERDLLEQQANGKHIVANGSRLSVQAIKLAVRQLVVVQVTAPIELLATRLAKRGRETESEIKQRLTRGAIQLPADVEVITIENDDTLEVGIDRFTEALVSRSQISAPPRDAQ